MTACSLEKLSDCIHGHTGREWTGKESNLYLYLHVCRFLPKMLLDKCLVNNIEKYKFLHKVGWSVGYIYMYIHVCSSCKMLAEDTSLESL